MALVLIELTVSSPVLSRSITRDVLIEFQLLRWALLLSHADLTRADILYSIRIEELTDAQGTRKWPQTLFNLTGTFHRCLSGIVVITIEPTPAVQKLIVALIWILILTIRHGEILGGSARNYFHY